MKTAVLSLFFSVFILHTFAQPPRANGRGASFLNPRPPRSPRRPAPGSSATDPECAAQTIRGLSGRCTSAVDPNLGEASRPQFSYLNVDSVKFSGEGLESARVISNIVSDQSGDNPNSKRLNELFVYFGQFIDHDFAASPVSHEEEEIEVPSDDPHLRISSMEFERSMRSPITADSVVERPITSLSSALDLSTVYGTDPERNVFLRVSNSCFMKTSPGQLLPFNTGEFLNAPSASRDLYIAGDSRVNEHPVLTTMHTVFLREHNHICGMLEENVSDMSPGDMYEAARAINIAQYQKIVYEEWLPAILGRKLQRYSGYKPNVDPTISLEFTTAGFRLGHTMVNNGVSRIDANGNRLPLITMEEMFFRPSTLREGDIEDFIRGAAGTRAQEVDAMVVDALRNFLFSNVPEDGGIDLISLNLQRGRDHNVPRFNELRQFFLGSPARSFQEISRDRTVQRKLRDAYGSVDNVEAWPGLMAEDKSGSAGLGRTNAALWNREFTRLRDGDRFFYLDNARHNQIPQKVLQALPTLNRDIFSNRPIFGKLLARTTSIPIDRVSANGVFRM
ncbi:Peroxinectin A [Gracilariopsis chorda]|uniref:Peroxinectin A n=1 Tax=Gracilariopsis chorda TaxID=448386 RepID=A0A2V3IJ95_9FLOR|nr:Peroxinectin A [Gracilariopsis chorda]PXF42142.1 Peroxinectin A [Gracilariopsis chorda]|eukprot:PXF42141.1 Peroxinectin A [Gracilariopsis chorda]